MDGGWFSVAGWHANGLFLPDLPCHHDLEKELARLGKRLELEVKIRETA